MYAAAHLDLIRAAVAERLGGSTRGAEPCNCLPRPHASPRGVRGQAVGRSSRSPWSRAPPRLELPSPRVVELTGSALLLDA